MSTEEPTYDPPTKASDAPRSLPIYRVKTPCEEPWEAMAEVGDDRRFCGLCAKDVHDLTHLSQEEMHRWIEDWRAERGMDAVCVRFYKRADGTLVEADCQPWRERVARHAKRAALWSSARLAAAAATFLALLGLSSKFDVFDGWSNHHEALIAQKPHKVFDHSVLMGDLVMEEHEVLEHE